VAGFRVKLVEINGNLFSRWFNFRWKNKHSYPGISSRCDSKIPSTLAVAKKKGTQCFTKLHEKIGFFSQYLPWVTHTGVGQLWFLLSCGQLNSSSLYGERPVLPLGNCLVCPQLGCALTGSTTLLLDPAEGVLNSDPNSGQVCMVFGGKQPCIVYVEDCTNLLFQIIFYQRYMEIWDRAFFDRSVGGMCGITSFLSEKTSGY